MASWLTHLRIAERIKKRINEIDFPYFIMGGIAPDSGISDEKKVEYTPSKEITHYKRKKEDGTYFIDQDAFFSKYLTPEKIMVRSDSTRSFLWGYYFHLITDKLWLEQYFEPFKKDFLKGSDNTEEEYIKLIREEMYSLDYKYLQENGKELLNVLKGPCGSINFFTEFDWDYICECRKRILEFYSEDKTPMNREPRYLTSDMLEEFIIKTSDKCIDILVI